MLNPNAKIRSHAAGVVLYRSQPNRLEIAAMNYRKWDEVTIRMFMGKQGFGEGGRSETFNETLVRELRQEAFNLTPEPKWTQEVRSLVYWELVVDDKQKGTPLEEATLLHLKGFRALRYEAGVLRDHRLTEEEGTPGEETLEPARWFEVSDLWRQMEPRRATKPIHRKAVAATVHRLAGLHQGIAFRYGQILEASAGIIQVVPEYMPIVRSYLESLDGEASSK